jgi:hypothetical protein
MRCMGMKIFAMLHKAEDPKTQPALELRARIEEIGIQLKGLYARFNHEMIRKESTMTVGEYNLLYPREEAPPPDT